MNLKSLISALMSIFCSILLSSCCINQTDSQRLISGEQARWIPDSTLTGFTMESEHGVKESFILNEFTDTTITLVDDRCGCETIFQRRWSVYRSTFANNHELSMEINTLNFARFDIGLNWDQQSSWDFDQNKQISHAYTSNDYPNPVTIEFIKDYTIKNITYTDVLALKFSTVDVGELGVIEAYFIPYQGLVHFRLKSGISYFRNPMPAETH